MKNIIVILTAFILFSSCREIIDGSGRFITQNRPVVPFEEIESNGDFSVYIKQDSIYSLTIYAEDNILPYITSSVTGRKLKIYTDDRFHKLEDHGVMVYITSPDISAISLSGSGTINSQGTIVSNHLKTALSGSGKMEITLDAVTSENRLSGSGHIYLHGKSINATDVLSGSGKIHAFDLFCEKVNATISGSGNCEVNARDYLNARISGSGDIIYIGHPVIIRNISGSGTVRPLQ